MITEECKMCTESLPEGHYFDCDWQCKTKLLQNMHCCHQPFTGAASVNTDTDAFVKTQ